LQDRLHVLARRLRHRRRPRQAREGGGIENASAALMDQLAISARESASRRARDGLERRVEHEGDPRRAERLSGGADGNCSEALLTGPSLVSVLAEEVQHYILAALSVRSAGRAAQVCCTWRALLTPDGAWREIGDVRPGAIAVIAVEIEALIRCLQRAALG
jgi:hypothetical protein